MREDYKTEISESLTELTPKEKIRFKQADFATLDSLIEVGETLEISPKNLITVQVHNEFSENSDYEVYIICSEEGEFKTSSRSFYESAKDIMEEMQAFDEPYKLSIYKRESRNYKGKFFITCTIV